MTNLKEHEKRYSKHLVTLLLAAILISTLFVGAALGFLTNQSTFTNHAQYIVKEGVAGNDYYDSRQYSYQVNQWANETVFGYGSATINPNPANVWFNAAKSLRVGFTEFGEFATLNNSGVAYGTGPAEWANSESWSSTGIPSQYWIQGWVFYMNYTRQTIVRNIEAYAVYSDTINTEAGRGVYSWAGPNTVDPVTMNIVSGTTRTVGSLNASGVQVLYDSARLVVARASVTIHDGFYNEDVAKITFTQVYNKDSKYDIVYKDLKILLSPKILDTINDLAFSERYEIDLAFLINPTNQAYIHWFHNYNASVYQHPLTGSNMTDVVQAFDVNRNYIFFAGYWPNCTEYSVYHELVPNIPLYSTAVLPQNTAQPDMPNEPSTPWVIAQWRYQSISAALPNYFPHLLNFLAKGVPNREIRFVEVFGMTDYNKPTTSNSISSGAAAAYNANATLTFSAKDINASDAVNNLDVEVRYMLYGKVFVPEDLTSINTSPFQWIGVGQSSATTDSAGAASLADLNQQILQNPLVLFDRNDTAFPYTAPTIGNKGSIPYGLSFGTTNYIQSFNNVATGGGTDPTTFYRTGLVGFAFGNYDGTNGRSPQPVAGGYSTSNTYWYPSKDPLTERWATAFPTTNVPNALYGGINYHPNGIITLGGEKANGLTRYFNDFNYAITREGTTAFALAQNGAITGSAPTSNPAVSTFDYFPISTWASSQSTFGYKNVNDTMGFAVISVARDVNGTRGLSVYGWDARDSYWGAAWASQYLGIYVNNGWIPVGTTALVISISYTSGNAEPAGFTVLKALGTITEFGTNLFTTNYGGYDAITGPTTWRGNVVPPVLGQGEGSYKVWWYAKFPTISTASVQFDP